MSGIRGPKVSSVRQLPQEIPPTRDLWPQLEARLKAEQTEATARHRVRSATRWRVASLAALIAAVAVGIWIGHELLPGTAPRLANTTPAPQSAGLAYLKDPRYLEARAAMQESLAAALARLPPQTRAKVSASLDTIHQSMRDIQAALGRDPGNALLQELLMNTYQDEMHVLTTAQEAGRSNEEI